MVALLGIACAFLASALALSIFVALPIVFALTYMCLIHTCELEGVNPFQYLTALQRHADALGPNPTAWLPWTYQNALAAAASV